LEFRLMAELQTRSPYTLLKTALIGGQAAERH
jgi:hypothetical protein